jgi:ABC-2 type transport system permease protein/oleandomycin transport system permease protein
MPGWLQAFARNQPVSVTVEAVRALTIGGPTSAHVFQALVWCGAIVAIFAPIAVRLYRRAL